LACIKGKDEKDILAVSSHDLKPEEEADFEKPAGKLVLSKKAI
jgi:hypothetical protein